MTEPDGIHPDIADALERVRRPSMPGVDRPREDAERR